MFVALIYSFERRVKGIEFLLGAREVLRALSPVSTYGTDLRL